MRCYCSYYYERKRLIRPIHRTGSEALYKSFKPEVVSLVEAVSRLSKVNQQLRRYRRKRLAAGISGITSEEESHLRAIAMKIADDPRVFLIKVGLIYPLFASPEPPRNEKEREREKKCICRPLTCVALCLLAVLGLVLFLQCCGDSISDCGPAAQHENDMGTVRCQATSPCRRNSCSVVQPRVSFRTGLSKSRTRRSCLLCTKSRQIR